MRTESKLEPAVQPKEDQTPAKEWKIKMLYDGECVLCMREVYTVSRLNRLRKIIFF